jgi:hypothetical protein
VIVVGMPGATSSIGSGRSPGRDCRDTRFGLSFVEVSFANMTHLHFR